MSKMNLTNKVGAGLKTLRGRRVQERTATVAGATTGIISKDYDIIELSGASGEANYYGTLPDPATVPFMKDFVIIVLAHNCKLATAGTSCKINGVEGQVTLLAGASYLARKISNTEWVVLGGTVSA